MPKLLPKPLIVLAHPLLPEVKAELTPQCRVIVCKSIREAQNHLSDADALITRFDQPVGEKVLKKAKRLRVVGNMAVGFDNVDLGACRRRGIRLVNTPGVLTRATAELALTLLMAAARRVPEGEMLCRSGKFKGWEPDMLLGIELQGRRAVVVGKGRIGKETARLFKGIGLKVDFITRQDSAASVRRKLRSAQILSLNLALNRQTHHWLDASRIGLLPRDCIVINTARGPVVDESALIRALAARRIFAAGLDVFEREPKIPPRLRRLKNVVLLPHLGSATGKTRSQMARLVAQGVMGVLGGKRPWNEVQF